MNTIKKYIFEVIVIFIGITISFIFDGWRNTRSEEQKEKEYYSLLLEDLKSDSLDIVKLFEDINFEQPRMDSILKKGTYLDVNKFSFDMCAPYGFKNDQNLIKSFESLRQSGDLKLFKSKELINKCNYILSRQSQLNSTIESESKAFAEYRHYLSKTYPDMALFCIRYQSRRGIKGKITERDVNLFLNDPQIMIYYNNMLWTSQAVKFYSTDIKKELEELKTILKKELNN